MPSSAPLRRLQVSLTEWAESLKGSMRTLCFGFVRPPSLLSQPRADNVSCLQDSFPLNLGATPIQVFIDGVKQFDQPHVVERPFDQSIPPSASDSASRSTAINRVTGKLSYAPIRVVEEVVFTNVRSVYEVNKENRVTQTFGDVGLQPGRANVVVRDAVVVCTGSCRDFTAGIENVVDLRGGSLIPGLVTYGGTLGVSEIGPEPSTNDGIGHDVLAGGVPAVLKGDLIRGVEALSLGQKFIP